MRLTPGRGPITERERTHQVAEFPGGRPRDAPPGTTWLVARSGLGAAHALLRRAGRLHSATTQAGDLVLDEATRAAWRSGQPLELTPTEFDLLVYLLARRGRAISKAELLTQVWGYGSYDPNLVEVHISSLRRKLEAHGPRIVHTARGHGYTIRF